MQETNMSNNEMSTATKEQSPLTQGAFHMFSMTQLIKHFEQMRENIGDTMKENRLLCIEIAKHAKRDMTSDIPTNKRKRVAELCVELNSWQGKLKKHVPPNVLNVIKTHEQKLCTFVEVYDNLEKYEDRIQETAAAINKRFNEEKEMHDENDSDPRNDY